VTRFVKALLNGDSFIDAANGVTVTQLATSVAPYNEYAEISVNFNGSARQPALSASPAIATACVAGEPLVYALTLTNNDDAGMAATTFDLSAVVPASWTASITPQWLTLGPGMSGTAAVTVASSFTASDGSYTITVSAADLTGGHAAATANVVYALNANPPLPITDLNATLDKKGAVLLSWTGSVGAVGYNVYRAADGNLTLLCMVTSTGYKDTSAVAGATYSYAVTAVDTVGNESVFSNIATISIPAKTSPSARPTNR
jgi:hypothetical protein